MQHFYQNTMMYKFFIILMTLSSLSMGYTNSFVNLSKEDGEVLISLVDDYPCFSLNANKEISSFYLRDMGGEDPKLLPLQENNLHYNGHCISYGYDVSHKFIYNSPYEIYIKVATEDMKKYPYRYHKASFCVLKSQKGTIRLVKARKSHFWETGGQFKCTDQDWAQK